MISKRLSKKFPVQSELTKQKQILKKPVVVAVSGYFNPLHVGHLEMIEKAKKLGDKLVVIINNDEQVALKERVPFMSEQDRMRIISALRAVDKVFLSIDDYKLPSGEIPVIKSLAKVRPDIFANGGDRHNVINVPEYDICKKLNIKLVDGLGKKIRASSQLISAAALAKECAALEKKDEGRSIINQRRKFNKLGKQITK